MPRTPQQAANEAASSGKDAPFFQRVDTLLDHPQDADLPVDLSTLKLQEHNYRVSNAGSSHSKELRKCNSVDAATVLSATAAAIAAFTAEQNQDTAVAIAASTAGAKRDASASGSTLSTGGLLTQSSRKSTLSVTAPPGALSKCTSLSPKKASKLFVSILDSDSEPLTQGVSVVLDSPLLQCHIESRSPCVRVPVEPESPPPSAPPTTTPGTSRRAPRSIFK